MHNWEGLERQGPRYMKRISKLAGCWGVGLWLLLGALCLAGCTSQQEFAPVPGVGATAGTPSGAVPATSPNKGTESVELIRVGDTLIVAFSDTPVPMQPMECLVRDDGKITLLQNQDFVAAGKKLGQLAKEIRAFYVPNFYPQMTVTVAFKPQTQFYYVGGEVKLPGRQVYLGPVHLLGAIKSAGDFTDFARRGAVRVTRADGRTFTVNCNKALKNPALDPEIFPGDNINVPRRRF